MKRHNNVAKIIKDNKWLICIVILCIMFNFIYEVINNAPIVFSVGELIFKITKNMTKISFLKRFILNLLNGICFAYISSLVFYIITDYIPKFKKEKVAMKQIKKNIEKHLKLLCYFYKSVLENKPDNIPEDPNILFNEIFYKEIKYMDFNTRGPVIEDITWLQYVRYEFQKLSDDLRYILIKYEVYLDTRIVNILEDFNSTQFIEIMIDNGRRRIFDGTSWREILYDLPKYEEPILLFDTDGGMAILRDYIKSLLKLISLYEENTIKIDMQLFNEGLSPLYGSARNQYRGSGRKEGLSEPVSKKELILKILNELNENNKLLTKEKLGIKSRFEYDYLVDVMKRSDLIYTNEAWTNHKTMITINGIEYLEQNKKR